MVNLDPATLAEIDEALAHARAVPQAERGDAWSAYVDGLLTRRLALAGTDAQHRETRPLFRSPETR